jgi:hypothetical protein
MTAAAHLAVIADDNAVPGAASALFRTSVYGTKWTCDEIRPTSTLIRSRHGKEALKNARQDDAQRIWLSHAAESRNLG